MIVIDEVMLPCEIIETNEYGEEKIFQGSITEVHYDTKGDPYMVQVNWNKKSRLICPRFENDAMRIKKRNGRGTIDIFVASE